MSAPQDRLSRLLARRPELVQVGQDASGSALIRRDQLLMPTARAGQVESLVAPWVARREDLRHLGVTRLHLRAGVDVPGLLTGVLARSGEPAATPVHVFVAEPDQAGPVHDPRPATRRLPPVGAAPSARRIDVAVLDTGLAPHTWFPAGSWEPLGFADVTDRRDTDPVPGDDRTGHGTFVAGVIRQQAPAAHLVVGRVLDSDGTCDEVALLAALHRLAAHASATRRPVDVLNLSLGAFTWNDNRPTLLARALLSLGPQTVVVAAAGNAGRARPVWPAALPSVVGVGALTADGSAIAEFSGRGPWVDAWAPGEHVTSSIAGRTEHTGQTSAQALWSGTSFAAAQVTALIAARAAATGSTTAVVVPAVLRALAASAPATALRPDRVMS